MAAERWVFGYGSLMWRPGFEYLERRNARLVGWQCGFETMFVAAYSYLPGVKLDTETAIDLATEALQECGWTVGKLVEPDWVR